METIINNNSWIFRSAAQPLDDSFVALLRMLLARFAVSFLHGKQHLMEPVHAMLTRAQAERVPHIPMFVFWIIFKFSSGVRETCHKQLANMGADTSRFDTLTDFVSATVLTALRSHEARDHSSLMALSSMVGPAVVRHDYDYMAACTRQMLRVVLQDTAHVRSTASERKRSNKKAATEDDYNNLVREFQHAIDINDVDPDKLADDFDSLNIDSDSEASASDSDYGSDSDYEDDSSDPTTPLSTTSSVGAEDLASMLPELARFTI